MSKNLKRKIGKLKQCRGDNFQPDAGKVGSNIGFCVSSKSLKFCSAARDFTLTRRAQFCWIRHQNHLTIILSSWAMERGSIRHDDLKDSYKQSVLPDIFVHQCISNPNVSWRQRSLTAGCYEKWQRCSRWQPWWQRRYDSEDHETVPRIMFYSIAWFFSYMSSLNITPASQSATHFTSPPTPYTFCQFSWSWAYHS